MATILGHKQIVTPYGDPWLFYWQLISCCLLFGSERQKAFTFNFSRQSPWKIIHKLI